MNSLTGRFLGLTILFVMLAEVLIFVPSVARFRADYLQARLERAQIASLALLGNDMLDMDLEEELLENAGVYNVVLVRDDYRQLMLSSPIPSDVDATFDMRSATAFTLIRDAIACLSFADDKVIRVIGSPVREGGNQIEVTLDAVPLREAMLDYGRNIFLLSLGISIFTATLLFFAVRSLLVLPIKRLVNAMKGYTDAPEDARQVIEPSAGVRELHEAEDVLRDMQTQLTGALRQRERLAQLGEAVAKISHDLRNILTTAQLFADRVEMSEDPSVKRAAPKLMNQIHRAVALCEGTLAFGKAQEPPPALGWFDIGDLVDEVIEAECLASGNAGIEFKSTISTNLSLRADPEQLYRVVANLLRNARQAIAATGKPGRIEVGAVETDTEWRLTVTDSGPGLPPRAQENLFRPFQAGVRKGGTGLGLAIAQELVKGHGGNLSLAKTDETGTTFVVSLPKSDATLDAAAE